VGDSALLEQSVVRHRQVHGKCRAYPCTLVNYRLHVRMNQNLSLKINTFLNTSPVNGGFKSLVYSVQIAFEIKDFRASCFYKFHRGMNDFKAFWSVLIGI
jgi:hypothetical protein